MKVLQHPPESKPVQHRCRKCGALLEIEKSDCRRVAESGDGMYHQPVLYAFNCPLCHWGDWVDPKKAGWEL